MTPVSNARVPEAVIHHVLAPYRLHDKHDLFELSASLQPGYDSQDTVLGLGQKAKLPLAPERPFCMEHASRSDSTRN